LESGLNVELATCPYPINHQSLGQGIYSSRTSETLIFAGSDEIRNVLALAVPKTNQFSDLMEGVSLEELYGKDNTISVLEELGFDEKNTPIKIIAFHGHKLLHVPKKRPTFNSQFNWPKCNIRQKINT
jgi:hypothetical protein